MSNKRTTILIVDDDAEFVSDFELLLPEKVHCLAAMSPENAEKALSETEFDAVFLDIDLKSETDGIALLESIKKAYPSLPVVMISSDHTISMVVEAMQRGASDYIGKTPDMTRLRMMIDRLLSERSLRGRLDILESEMEALIGEMIGESEQMRAVKSEMKRLAEVNSNVLITGESGTGKELVARGIHKLGTQKDSPFVAVNCAALSKDLFESELFGHEKGAFTGALSRRRGKFELVESGTLFLDEVTEIPVNLQAKLLRVLQEREFERIGGNDLIPFEGRLLASSNRDIRKSIEEGEFRDDLYYRLNVTSIHLPPLSERQEDIPLLADHFVNLKANEIKKPISGISDEAMNLLTSYDWPGNVRELVNCIENAVVHCDGDLLQPRHFSQLIVSHIGDYGSYEEAKKQHLSRFQRDYISRVLKKNRGNVSQTAKDMGVSRQGLIKMMESCGIQSSAQ